MPVEYETLRYRPVPMDRCPGCGLKPFKPFLRGQVHSYWRKFFRRPYCALICLRCKQIVGHEKP